MNATWNEVFHDLALGAAQYDAYLRLGYDDILKYYRRSTIGALWVTVNVALFVAGIGLFYSMILSDHEQDYFLSFGIGYVFWYAIASSLTNACTTFTKISDVLLQRRTTLSEHAFRQISREFFLFLHTLPIIFILVLLLGESMQGMGYALTALAILAFLYIGFWLAIILGVISALWRDIPPIMTSITSLLFFLTPIIWSPDAIPDHLGILLHINPAAAMIELLRDAIMNVTIKPWVYMNLALTSVLVTIAGLMAMRLTKHRLAYWL